MGGQPYRARQRRTGLSDAHAAIFWLLLRRSELKGDPWGIAAFGPEGTGLRSLGAPKLSIPELAHHREMTRLLQDVVDHGTGWLAALDDDSVAGKTGTSQDYRDDWFLGFNKTLVVGVWVGNDDRSPMKGVTGGSLPAQIWRRFVSAATPLVDRLKDSAVGEVTSFSLPMTVKQAQCDQTACAAAYSSFRSSDCTYQPNAGQRRLSKKVVPEALKLSRAFRLPQSPVSAILTAALDAIDPSIP